MPTGATLVFSHGQSRENNSWASTVCFYTKRLGRWSTGKRMRRGRRGRERGWRGRLNPTKLAKPVDDCPRQYRHKFALKVEKLGETYRLDSTPLRRFFNSARPEREDSNPFCFSLSLCSTLFHHAAVVGVHISIRRNDGDTAVFRGKDALSDALPNFHDA